MVFGVKWLIYFRGRPKRQKVKSYFKWSVFVLGLYSRWCITRLNSWTFLINIGDLSNNIKSKFKFFADDTSLFSVACYTVTFANDLNHDLEEISE